MFVPNEDVDGLAVIGAKHNVGGTQEGLQDVDETWRHLLHVIKKEDRSTTFCQAALHPALQLLLRNNEGKFSPDSSFMVATNQHISVRPTIIFCELAKSSIQ